MKCPLFLALLLGASSSLVSFDRSSQSSSIVTFSTTNLCVSSQPLGGNNRYSGSDPYDDSYEGAAPEKQSRRSHAIPKKSRDNNHPLNPIEQAEAESYFGQILVAKTPIGKKYHQKKLSNREIRHYLFLDAQKRINHQHQAQADAADENDNDDSNENMDEDKDENESAYSYEQENYD